MRCSIEALAALRKAREDGQRRAHRRARDRPGQDVAGGLRLRPDAQRPRARTPRVLFLAHRRELLRQAAADLPPAAARVEDDRARGVVRRGRRATSAQTWCSRRWPSWHGPSTWRGCADSAFDYVVVDEVHHAAARSYRQILDAMDPGFLLGLTATPERADSADILGLFDDFIAYQAGIGRGIALGRLVPFHYFGIKDEIDYENIPWRNRRFDPEVLARAAQTEARMETLWRAWEEHPGKRSMVFCCSIAHALYVRDWLRSRGVRAAAVHAGEGSDDRDAGNRGARGRRAGRDLRRRRVQRRHRPARRRSRRHAAANRVGRSCFCSSWGADCGPATGKSAVTVIDFVGNHRMFLERIRMLLSLGGTGAVEALRGFLGSGAAGGAAGRMLGRRRARGQGASRPALPRERRR